MQKLDHIPTLADIQETHLAIQPMIHRTPVLTNQSINQIAGLELFFKCENFQKVGAFKMRGGASAALRLTEAEKQVGITTHSSGNHAQAVARSAQTLGIPAYIVMPENAPAIKKAATKDYGAEIIFCEPTLEGRESTVKEVIAQTGATFLHPYNDYNIIAGQATAAKELIEDTNELDIIIAPIGGGGLMSGTALCAKYLSPKTKTIGVEPEQADDAYRSFKSGEMQFNTSFNTIADGLRTNLGEFTFDIIHRHLEDVLTVTEEEIIAAMQLVWERMKIIIEPSSAVPLAAVLKDKSRFANKRVGIIFTGGNVDLEKLPF